jgi:predicted Zn-dependent protease with MMP-like domain
MPTSVPPPAFSQLVQDAIDQIPARFRRRLHNVAFLVRPRPTRRQLAAAGVKPGATLLGLYEGRPLTQRSVFEPFALPDRIYIFQEPHETMARNFDDLTRLIRQTVWHEVAHYFGMDEARVRAAERRHTKRP